METIGAVALAGGFAWFAAVVVRLAVLFIAVVQPRPKNLRGTRADRPRVSVLVPVKTVDIAFEPALAALLAQDYPDFETVICGDSEAEAAFAAARAIEARFPGAKVRYVTSDARIGPNPKINNLAAAIPTVDAELLLIKDSNIVMDKSELRRLVADLTEGVGLVCAIPIAVRTQGFAAEVERAVMNGHGAPLVLAGAALGLDIGYGKVMLVRRRDFEAVDGLTVMAPHFGDDHALALALRKVGLRTVFTDRAVVQPLGQRRFAEVWDRQLRWMVIRRNQEVASFLAEPLATGAFAALAAAFGAPLFGLSAWAAIALTAVLWIATEAAFLARRGWGMSPMLPFAVIARDALLLALWLRAWFTHRVSWRGSDYDVA